MSYKTTCSYCGVGCGIIVSKDNKGRLHVEGDKDHPVNRGKLCSKGRNLHYVVQDTADRILYPSMRSSKNHPHERVSWDKAMNRAASVFKTFIKKYGPDSVGFYVSGQCLTEEYYVVNKLSKGFIGTNNIDTNSRLCMSSAVVGYKKALGEDAVPVSYDDIELADCFFITGANPAWCHPILFRRIEEHKEKNPHIKIIVVDPRKTQSCSIADVHLQINPGTDVYLNNAISKYLIENGMVDDEFIRLHSVGFSQLLEVLSEFSIEEAVSICGIEMVDFEEAASYIGNAKRFISLWAMGLNQSESGTDKNLSLLNISLITGMIGKPGCGPFSLTGQPNAMGGREVGGMCNLLPAHRDLANAGHRAEVAKFWNVDSIPEKPGYTATEMFEKLAEDKMKAIWIICTNPLVSLPNVRIAEEALKKARFVIVQDISNNSITTEYADIIFPAAGWLEKEGTMTNSDRRISYLPKVIDAPGEAIPDVDILNRFAKAMHFKGFNYNSVEEIFNEHRQLTENTNIDISGLSYDYLKNKGTAQWPFTNHEKKETKRLFTDFKFYTPHQKAIIHAVRPNDSAIKKNKDYPLILTTGRIRDQWHTMTRTGKVQRLNQHIQKPFLEMHPDDAKIRNLNEKDITVVKSSCGEVKVEVAITDSIKKGVVFLPMHWGKILQSDLSRTNNLTSGKVDPVSKEPDYKYTRVEVSKYVKPAETIVIVGAGAAAYKFIETYRKSNKTDKILVFSAEPDPFYNRVLLPEYISGGRSFDNLVKIEESEFEELNIQVFSSNKVERVNPNEKTIIDANGASFGYDKLILCTGSSPHMPPHLKGKSSRIYTLRNKYDADAIKEEIVKGNIKNALIVGGGLLGMEAASALLDLNLDVSIVHRNTRLMDKQLDFTASNLLSDVVAQKNINLFFNDEVEEILSDDDDDAMTIVFKSGKKHVFEMVIFAVGAKPRIELAVDAKLKTNRGVIVNGKLQTSKEDIFAIGEIAEINGQTFGITSAAEEQAVILAQSIAGHTINPYSGSVPMNILKFPGIELCSIGVTKIPNEIKNECEEIIFSDLGMYSYKKCIIKGDKLIGAILMGDKNEFTEFRSLIENNQELSELRMKLLRSGKPLPPVKGKLVCSCNNVGQGNIIDEINKGVEKLEVICQNTGAGLGCGSCTPEIKVLLKTNKLEKELAILVSH